MMNENEFVPPEVSMKYILKELNNKKAELELKLKLRGSKKDNGIKKQIVKLLAEVLIFIKICKNKFY